LTLGVRRLGITPHLALLLEVGLFRQRHRWQAWALALALGFSSGFTWAFRTSSVASLRTFIAWTLGHLGGNWGCSLSGSGGARSLRLAEGPPPCGTRVKTSGICSLSGGGGARSLRLAEGPPPCGTRVRSWEFGLCQAAAATLARLSSQWIRLWIGHETIRYAQGGGFKELWPNRSSSQIPKLAIL
jgi:hypothetical protein